MSLAKRFDPVNGPEYIGRYELLGEIASGGTATVFLARLRGAGGFQRFFAIKCLLQHLAHETEFVQMFLDEARIAAGIHHANVVPILEIGASPAGYYIVMEYVEGLTLAQLLNRGIRCREKIPVAITLRIALDMLAGLHAAHESRGHDGQPANLIHRDVSPQNVLVAQEGIARITDFGVARATSRLSTTRQGQLKGKLAYMSPEHVNGDEHIDRRADVFSAAIVIWETLAGRRLFKANNEAALLNGILSGTLTSLLDAAPHVDPRISAVIMRALSRDRDIRFDTCALFADALEQSARGAQRPALARELGAYVQRALDDEATIPRSQLSSWISDTAGTCADATLPDSPPFPWSTSHTSGLNLPNLGTAAAQRRRASRRRVNAIAVGITALLLVGSAVGAFLGVRSLGQELSLVTAVPFAVQTHGWSPLAMVRLSRGAQANEATRSRATKATVSASVPDGGVSTVPRASAESASVPRRSAKTSHTKVYQVTEKLPKNPYR
jgi:serine/threonine-protein kinase